MIDKKRPKTTKSMVEKVEINGVEIPKLDSNWINNLNVEEFDDFDSDQETDRDRQFFMEQSLKEMKEEQEKAKLVMLEFQTKRDEQTENDQEDENQIMDL